MSDVIISGDGHNALSHCAMEVFQQTGACVKTVKFTWADVSTSEETLFVVTGLEVLLTESLK